ncbi:hypothetical protein ACHAW6_016146 [Cyclotella cf. meneghiniana]
MFLALEALAGLSHDDGHCGHATQHNHSIDPCSIRSTIERSSLQQALTFQSQLKHLADAAMEHKIRSTATEPHIYQKNLLKPHSFSDMKTFASRILFLLLAHNACAQDFCRVLTKGSKNAKMTELNEFHVKGAKLVKLFCEMSMAFKQGIGAKSLKH